MTWFFAVVVVLAMGGIALVASGRGAPMVDEYDDRPDALVPADGEIGPQDLRRVRFSLAFRGYRMSEVDALLTRLAAEMEADRAWQPGDPVASGETAGSAEPVALHKPAEASADGQDPQPPPG